MPVALLAYEFGLGLAAVAAACWIAVWALVAVRVLGRSDLGAGGKVAWLAVILLIPLLGLFLYALWDASRARPV